MGLVTEAGGCVIVTSVWGDEAVDDENTVTVYNFEVEDWHTYFVGEAGVLVHNRCNINGKYAGQTKYLDDPELKAKYPDGVKFTEDGFAEFTPYSKDSAKFDSPSAAGKKNGTCLTGNRGHDARLANKQCGYDKTPKGYIWHHNQDMVTMELIPRDIHEAVRHTGGASLIKEFFKGLE